MSEPIDTSHSLAQPTLPEAMLVEDLALAGVTIIAAVVPGGTELRNVTSAAIDVWEKDGPTIEEAVATFLGFATKLVGVENLRKALDAETIKLANQAADLAEEVKFGPRK